MDLPDPKAALRAELRARRDAFAEALDAPTRALSFRVPPTPLRTLIAEARVVAAYVPAGSEADPRMLLAFARDAGCTTALPYIERPSVPMRFLAWSPGEPLGQGRYGIDQPDPATAPEVAPDLILAPLVGFDRRLHRIGQGGGFYDRAFARFTDAKRIGIGWSVQEVDLVPEDPWDVPLDAVLTEREWIA